MKQKLNAAAIAAFASRAAACSPVGMIGPAPSTARYCRDRRVRLAQTMRVGAIDARIPVGILSFGYSML
jgi:hypothetical protein